MAYRMLKEAGVAPPWIEADKEARAWLARRDEVLERAGDLGPFGVTRARRELATVVDAANRAIDRLNAEAPTSAQHRRRLDPAAELEAFDRRSGRGV